MACEKGDFGPRGGIVQPDADAAGHCYPRAVRRRGHPVYDPFAQADESAVGQIEADVVLGTTLLREQDADQQQGDAGQRQLLH